jgi:predicted nucleotide-binding protein (sugar kinase/HSP70/actin superfamily)
MQKEIERAVKRAMKKMKDELRAEVRAEVLETIRKETEAAALKRQIAEVREELDNIEVSDFTIFEPEPVVDVQTEKKDTRQSINDLFMCLASLWGNDVRPLTGRSSGTDLHNAGPGNGG